MSENTIEYCFTNKNKPKSIKSVVNKICKLHSIKNQEDHNVCCGKDKDKYFISLWCDDIASAPYSDVLSLLSTFPSDDIPFARVWIDSTNDVYYYALESDSLMTFNSEKEMNDHFDIGETSVESEFYEQMKRTNSQLFVRLRMSRKKQLKTLLNLSEDYIESGLDSAFSNLAKEIDYGTRSSQSFPHTYNYCKRRKDYQNFGKSLYFARSHGNYLYLGFEYPENVKITPCKKGDAYYDAIRNIKNPDGILLLELVECLLAKEGVSSINAKFISVKKGFSGSFWSREGMFVEYSPLWYEANLPARFW